MHVSGVEVIEKFAPCTDTAAATTFEQDASAARASLSRPIFSPSLTLALASHAPQSASPSTYPKTAMIQRTQTVLATEGDLKPKWFNSPVAFHQGSLADVRACIPTFERREFGVLQAEGGKFRVNDRLDTIVRLPFGQDEAFIPVGVVSKEYALVPHSAILDVATKALAAAKVSPDDVHAELSLTEYGERMALSLFLPEKFSFDPGDGHPMAMRLECLNSVDGSTRFRALMGWFRFVCSNGLIIGVTRTDMRRRHVGDFQIDDIGAVLLSGLNEAEAEKENLVKWRKTLVTIERLARWTENTLLKEWGFKAATRAYHIARTGSDVEIAGQYKENKPTTIPVRRTRPVPGTPKVSTSLYDVSQVLAWLAKERRDLQEQLAWREKIPELIKPLMN